MEIYSLSRANVHIVQYSTRGLFYSLLLTQVIQTFCMDPDPSFRLKDLDPAVTMIRLRIRPRPRGCEAARQIREGNQLHRRSSNT